MPYKKIDNDCGIYMIINIINGKMLIGSSNALRKRKVTHFYHLRHRKHINPHIQSSVNKYGLDNFEFRIVERCKEENLIERETYWVEYYQTMDIKFGYNIRHPDRHKSFSKETLQKMSDSHKGQRHCLGYKHSNEAKRNMRLSHVGQKAWNKGKKATEEAKRNQSVAQIRSYQIRRQNERQVSGI
jgi:group I intron endonuclease